MTTIDLSKIDVDGFFRLKAEQAYQDCVTNGTFKPSLTAHHAFVAGFLIASELGMHALDEAIADMQNEWGKR